MTNELTTYTQHYQIFIKDIEEPIEVSAKGGEIIMRMLEDKDCPQFIRINGSSYNRFEIKRIIPFKLDMTEKEYQTLQGEKQRKERMEEFRRQKRGY